MESGLRALTLALVLRSRALSPLGVGGINQMGVCGRLVRPQSPIPFSPFIVPVWTPWRPDGHSLNPDVSGWPALLDCRIRLTAFLPSHSTAAAGRSECPTTEAWHHRPESALPKISPKAGIINIDIGNGLLP